MIKFKQIRELIIRDMDVVFVYSFGGRQIEWWAGLVNFLEHDETAIPDQQRTDTQSRITTVTVSISSTPNNDTIKDLINVIILCNCAASLWLQTKQFKTISQNC